MVARASVGVEAATPMVGLGCQGRETVFEGAAVASVVARGGACIQGVGVRGSYSSHFSFPPCYSREVIDTLLARRVEGGLPLPSPRFPASTTVSHCVYMARCSRGSHVVSPLLPPEVSAPEQ